MSRHAPADVSPADDEDAVNCAGREPTEYAGASWNACRTDPAAKTPSSALTALLVAASKLPLICWQPPLFHVHKLERKKPSVWYFSGAMPKIDNAGARGEPAPRTLDRDIT